MQERDKTLEVFFIRRGKLHFQTEIGRKAPLTHLEQMIEKTYFLENEVESIELSREEVDEIQDVHRGCIAIVKELPVFILSKKAPLN